MANGRNGLATSDSRNPISGTIVPPDGIRLLATSAPGSIKAMNQQIGMDQSGLLRLSRDLGGSDYDTDLNPRMDGSFWRRTDSGQEWTQSSSSSAH